MNEKTRRVTIEIPDKLFTESKKIIKENGFFWLFALEQIIMRELTRVVNFENIEEILKR